MEHYDKDNCADHDKEAERIYLDSKGLSTKD